MAGTQSLATRLIARSVIAFVFIAVFLFVPAGSVHYWQGWVFLAIIFLPMVFTSFYFYKKDPQLVERRLQSQETVSEQKVIMKLASPIFFASFLIPGLDYRFGWSHVPLWLRIVSQILALAGYLFTYWVLEVNSFASRTIRVEAQQKVISTGPYRLVRHPMYFGAVIMLLFAPLALGSYWAFPGFALLVVLIILRLLNEEKVLLQQLPGYSEYCLQTRHHLIPGIW
jgi:protein-S-isoprenylcysteine O-methyltransferase Ste14